jgi:hypothetical protein
MWISEKLREQSQGSQLFFTHVVTSGEQPSLGGLGSARVLHPYGVFFRLPAGESVGCLEDLVLGTSAVPPVELEEGEVCLYTQGGYLLLTQDGRLIHNGNELT